jgi:DNA-binding transcriptional LysR family regulator
MIDRLEMFVVLAQERHFGRAAERLGITQPTLSSALKGLEEMLGVQLVQRGSRFQRLTAEGERVYARALPLLADTRALKEEMRAVRQGLTGDLRIGAVPTALAGAADLTAPFATRHPGIRIAILSRTSAEILDQIDNLRLDAGLTYLDDEAKHRREWVPLYAESYALLVAAGDAQAGKARLGWTELGEVPLCLLTPDMQNRRIVDGLLAEAGVAAVPRVESNSYVALIGHVLTGRWAAVVPAKLAAILAAGGALAAVPIEGGRAETIGLVTAQRDPHTPAVAALLAAAREMAGR